jgi:hypothetical protein
MCPEDTVMTVVLRMCRVDLVTVPLAVSLMPKGIGKERGRSTTLYLMPVKVEAVDTHDVGCHEGRAGVVACQDLSGGGINEADESADNFDRSILCLQEPGVIAAMTKEVFKFNSGFGVSEGKALWLEDWADVLVWCYNIETRKEAVIHQRNDGLLGGEQLLEAGKMENMMKERPEQSHGRRETVKSFSVGFSLEEASVLIG